MRADRLISMLMLLQARDRMTAAELAEELEVSERTIYRDLIALSIAGIPVYSERGPGGGISLIEEYHTKLTGMTSDEVRALFMLNIPTPLLTLGVGLDLQSAMRKLSASLPESKRLEETLARERIHMDSSWWFQSEDSPPFLVDLKEAVWNNKMVKMKFRTFYDRKVNQEVSPYGLVAKANIWYLVYGWEGIPRAVRISRIVELSLLAKTFIRPTDFDLVDFWENWCREVESQPSYKVDVMVSAQLLPQLRYHLGDRYPIPRIDPITIDKDGWVEMQLQFETFQAARTALLGLGRAVEVLEPKALRKSMEDFANQIVDLYRSTPQR